MKPRRAKFARSTRLFALALYGGLYGGLCGGLGVGLGVAPAFAFTLEFPGAATVSTSQPATRASYALPTARWEKGGLPTRVVSGVVERAAWHIDAPKLTSLDLMAPLRAQLIAAGFQPVFECETEGCGGFDFRFAIKVLPEPDMHVDLGDFRFLSAERPVIGETDGGMEAVGLLVSRSATQGFVQITHATADAGPPLFAATNKASGGLTPRLTADAAGGFKTAAAAGMNAGGDSVTLSTSNRTALLPVAGSSMAQLVTGGAVVLEGLDFGTGSTNLTEGRYASLADLAAWLAENPDKTIALVGHTDASGGLDTNIVVSKRRAASVRARLIDAYNIPAAQVEAQGVGYLSPVDTNLTEEGRQKNRRVEVILTSTQ